jgi:uncharacterized membrane protein YciS (DUF1049 family)
LASEKSKSGDESPRSKADSASETGPTMPTTTDLPPPRQLRRHQFSLETLVAAMTILGLVLGWLVDRNQLLKRIAAVESSIDAKVASRTAELREQLNLRQRLQVSEHSLQSVEGLLKRNMEVYADVTTVSLDDSKCVDADVAMLVQFPTIRCVQLHDAQLTNAVANHLAKLPNLEKAWLSGPWITDETIAALSVLEKLDGLGLDDSNISDAGLEQLGKLSELETLLLIGSPVSDEGLHHLTSLHKLHDLRLDQTQISDAGLAVLGEMPNLSVISIGKTKVTQAGREELQKKLPQCRILP